MTGFGFDGAHATAVRPAHQPADAENIWARDESAPGANDGTRITASLVNMIIANLRQLASDNGVALTDGADTIVTQAVSAAITAQIAAIGIADVDGLTAALAARPVPHTAAAAPTADDDGANTSGNGVFSAGQKWIDTAGAEIYICVDNSTGAAVWETATLSLDDLGALAVKNTVAEADIQNNAVTAAALDALDVPANGEVLAWNSASSRFEWVEQAGGGGWTFHSQQSLSGHTARNWASIPTDAMAVQITWSSVSSDGVSDFLVRIGDAGGIETSGYRGVTHYSTASAKATNGFPNRNANAGVKLHGVCTLHRVTPTSKQWMIEGHFWRSNSNHVQQMGGEKTLSANLDRVEVRVQGLDGSGLNNAQFTAGWIHVNYR